MSARLKATKIEFETRYYFFAHGKEPRGRGWWSFEFAGGSWPNEAWLWQRDCTYAEAKKAVAAQIKADARFAGMYVRMRVCS